MSNKDVIRLTNRTARALRESARRQRMIFRIAAVVLTLLIHMICYVFELPVLRHLDALAGGLFGLVRGALLVFIFFALVPIVLAVAPIEQLQTLIDGSRLAPMFDSGIILSILRSGG